jgi:hypothetical protein
MNADTAAIQLRHEIHAEVVEQLGICSYCELSLRQEGKTDCGSRECITAKQEADALADECAMRDGRNRY